MRPLVPALITLTTLLVTAVTTGCAATPTPAANPRWIVAGYTVPWDARSATAGATARVSELSPVWLRPTDAGGLVFASPEAERAAAGTGSASGLPPVLLPSISNFRDGRWDGPLVHRLLDDPRMRADHVAGIADLVRARGWAGVDLDYEALPARDRDSYSAFVRELAASLHRSGKRLTVTVHAKTAEPGDWSGAQAQDWTALGHAADEIRVMAYDHATSGSAPGPVAPLPWVEEVLTLAIAEVPRAKILLGVATYGYDWARGQPGRAVQWADARTTAGAHQAPVNRDARSGSPWFGYTDGHGRPHKVWYEDARSAAAKIDLARRYGIAGVVIWRLGGEDPGLWAALGPAADPT